MPLYVNNLKFHEISINVNISQRILGPMNPSCEKKHEKALRIGVSNYDAEQVQEIIGTFKEAPAVNQAMLLPRFKVQYAPNITEPRILCWVDLIFTEPVQTIYLPIGAVALGLPQRIAPQPNASSGGDHGGTVGSVCPMWHVVLPGLGIPGRAHQWHCSKSAQHLSGR